MSSEDIKEETDTQASAEQNTESVANQAVDSLPELQDYDQIEGKLKEIQDKVENEDMSLDESLDLYEQAVALGMQATKTIEQNVTSHLHKDDKGDDGIDGEGRNGKDDNTNFVSDKKNAPSSSEIFND